MTNSDSGCTASGPRKKENRWKERRKIEKNEKKVENSRSKHRTSNTTNSTTMVVVVTIPLYAIIVKNEIRI